MGAAPRKTIRALFVAVVLPAYIGQAMAQETYSQMAGKLRSDPNAYSWLDDRSLNGVDFVNMVLCAIRLAGADLRAVVNQGPYVAEVNSAKCERGAPQASVSAASSEGQSTSTPAKLESWVVDSRTSGADLDVRLWADFSSDENWPTILRARISIPLESDSDIPFNRLDFENIPVDTNGVWLVSQRASYGFLEVSRSGESYLIRQAERHFDDRLQDSEVDWANLVRSGTGQNVTLLGSTGTSVWTCSGGNCRQTPYEFSLIATGQEFRRKYCPVGSNNWSDEACFDRTKLKFSTWNYNLYDTSSERLVDLKTQVPIQYGNSSGGRGSLNRWGVWLQDNKQLQSMLAAAGSSNGSVAVTAFDDWSSRTGSPATLLVKNGQMRKVTNLKTTLGSLKDVTLRTWSPSRVNNGCEWAERSIVWDGVVFRDVSAGPHKPQASPPVLAPILTLDSRCTSSIWLWAGHVSYEVRAPQANDLNDPNSLVVEDWLLLTDSTIVKSRKENTLSAEDEARELEGKTLVCLTSCPVPSNQVAGDFDYIYPSQYGPGLPADFDGANQLTGQAGVTYSIVGGKLFTKSNSPYPGDLLPLEYSGTREYVDSCSWAPGAQNPCPKYIQTGPLVVIPIADARRDAARACNWNDRGDGVTNLCGWTWQTELDSYYYWSSGEAQWNKGYELLVGGKPVSFDDELALTFTCAGQDGCTPGQKFSLTYGGAGSLWGFPHKCVNPLDKNEDAACNDGAQWVNQFNLTSSPISGALNGSRVTLTNALDPSKSYFVLPQGSGEWYESKSLGSCAVGSPSDSVNAVDVDAPNGFQGNNLADMRGTSLPLDVGVTPARVRDGELVN